MSHSFVLRSSRDFAATASTIVSELISSTKLADRGERDVAHLVGPGFVGVATAVHHVRADQAAEEQAVESRGTTTSQLVVVSPVEE